MDIHAVEPIYNLYLCHHDLPASSWQDCEPVRLQLFQPTSQICVFCAVYEHPEKALLC